MPSTTRCAVLLVAVWLLVVAAPAAATTTRIGAVEEIGQGMRPVEPSNGGDTVQIAEESGTYAVPAGYGVITAWEHSTGSIGGALQFKVYRPTGIPGRFLAVASDGRTVTAGALHTFAVRFPVRPGDRLGLSSAPDTVHLAFRTFSPADQFAFFPPDSYPQPGSTVTQDGPAARNYKLDVAARVETDADRDGYGDDTQDRCPTNAATYGPCAGGAALPLFPGCSAAVANVLRGSGGPNTITGTRGRDRILAGAGNDRVDGLGGGDCLELGTGDDRAQGGSSGDLVLGGRGRDRIAGESGNDRLRAGSGNDRLSGGSGRDALDGGSGGDRLTGGSGGDRIAAGSGNDRVGARDRRRDRVSCGRGRDSVTADRIDRVARDCERVRRR